ncbi:helix-turn-helix transcriptional regulator [Amycolatopsis anabasis]|uniref:helix-turn-helix transcriptional regulator n=1 Tax=Amycolatopsis anabasis TaxID=1840409 RepID=UPI00131ECC06|nr:helix-turn-helix domain-containing protein [Amycolatopsis anabasis]
MASVAEDRLPAAATITSVAALDDDLRREMYAFIRRAQRPVTREEAATAVGISRKLAAFHLDKLVRANLLRTRSEPVGGVRRVGRTPKVYEPSGAEISVTIPQRRPDVLADILLDAVLAERADESARRTALRVAREHGAELGAAERARARTGRLGAERALTLAETALVRYGFEPSRPEPTRLRLRNCPFRPHTAKAPELVCGINHAFLSGFLTGLGVTKVVASLTPAPGHCCVELGVRCDPEG